MNPAPSQPQKFQLSMKALALLGVIFLLGAVAGVGGTMIYFTHRLQTNFRENLLHPERTAGGVGDRMLDRYENELDDHLNLNTPERKAVRAELDQTRAELQNLRAGVSKDLRSTLLSTYLRVGRALPTEKRPLAREVARERMKRWGLHEE